MKKITLLFAVLFNVLTAVAAPPIPEKVLQDFAAAFPTATNVRWYADKSGYSVYVDDDSMKVQLQYDPGGHVVSTRRYYYARDLNPFIKATVISEFPNRRIYGVTEITKEQEMYYEVIMEDEKSFVHVQCSPTGQTAIVKKFKKG